MSNNISKHTKYDNKDSDNKELDEEKNLEETKNPSNMDTDDEIKKIYEKWEKRLENEDEYEEREIRKLREKRKRKSNTFSLISGGTLIIMSALGLLQLLTSSEEELQNPQLFLMVYTVFGVIGLLITISSLITKKKNEREYKDQNKNKE